MLIVKKFGGTSVANKERIFNVARRCIEDYKAGHDVVVVLSAMGDTTDELIELANSINPDAKKRELDMLLTTGEQVSVSLMAMAMQALDVPAVSCNMLLPEDDSFLQFVSKIVFLLLHIYLFPDQTIYLVY